MSGLKPYESDIAAKAYDVLCQPKDYPGEAAWIAEIANRRGLPLPPQSILDVGAGTGMHLAAFRKSFPETQLAGLDVSAAMVGRAVMRLPGVRLWEGDMRDFNLGRKFQIVTTLFAAVSYLDTPSDMLSGLQSMSRHAEPGGLVVIEPNRPGELMGSGVNSVSGITPDGEHVIRMSHWDNRNNVDSNGEGSIKLDMDYVYGYKNEEGDPVVYRFSEVHRFGAFRLETYAAAMQAAGLDDISIEEPPGHLTWGVRPLVVGRMPENY